MQRRRKINDNHQLKKNKNKPRCIRDRECDKKREEVVNDQSPSTGRQAGHQRRQL